MNLLPNSIAEVNRVLNPVNSQHVNAAIQTVKSWAQVLGQATTCVLCGCMLIDTASLASEIAKQLGLTRQEYQDLHGLLGIFIFKFLGQGHWESVQPKTTICGVCESDDD